MNERRVVVTGMGVVTPLGVGVESFWTSLTAGRSAVTGVNLMDGGGVQTPAADGGEPQQIAAPVSGFDIRPHVPDRKLLRIMCRTDQFGLAAAQMAVADSGPADLDASRKGAFVATGKEMGPIAGLFDVVRASRDGMGELVPDLLGLNSVRYIPPLTLVTGLPNGCLFAVSVLHSIHGSNTNFLGSGEAGLAAIGAAYLAIREGHVDWALAGGHDSGVDRWSYANFHRMAMLTSRTAEPGRAVKPFDRHRDGFALGEGAAMMVLEERGRARARGASIRAEILGVASSCDATGMIAPRPDGSVLAAAIGGALRKASVEPAAVDHVNAYASATVAGDASEIRALESVFGGARRRPLVSGIKGATGHLLAASGAVELAATVLSLQRQTAPPTANLEELDAECHFDCVVGQSRPADIAHAVTISRGIGGQNVAMVLRRGDEG